MSKKKKDKKESVLQGAMLNSPVEALQAPEKKTSAVITVPLAVVGIAVVVFGLVKLIKFAWYF